MKFISMKRSREIIKNTNLLETISKDIELRDDGTLHNRFSGVCPFCSKDKFAVSTNGSPVWYCFGCGTGGTVISYVMKRDKVGYDVACETLERGKPWAHQPEKKANLSSCLKSDAGSKTVSIN